MTMPRDKVLAGLAEHVSPDDIVVAVYQTNFDWMALYPRDLNYVAVGAMGQASSHGLGLALANPDRRVFVLDGDGSLLMNLGALVTIAGASITNLYHFVFVNGVYEVNGKQPLPGTGDIDFAGLARSAGYLGSAKYGDLEAWTEALPGILAAPGPQFAALDVVAGAAYPRDYDYIHSAEAREVFREALNRPRESRPPA